MRDLLKSAAVLRDEASRDRKDGELDDATDSIRASSALLMRLWKQRRRAIKEAGAAASPDDKELVKELAETYGVMGGIYRSSGAFLKAIDAYDRGEYFEQHPARKGDNSYNLMQRLLNRALLDPRGADSAAWTVHRLHMLSALQHADAVLSAQRSTTRLGDVWAAADQAMAHTLLAPLDGQAPRHREAADRAWDALGDTTPPFVFDSTLRALGDTLREFEPLDSSHPGAAIIVGILKQSIDRLQKGFARARRSQA